MSRNFFSATLIILVLSWYIMYGVLDRDYDIVEAAVQDTVYSYTQIAAKKGILYKSVYDEMNARLGRLAGTSYEVFLKAEKFQGGSSDPLVLSGTDVIDTDLRAAGYDLITIHVIYFKPHPVSAMFRLPGFLSIGSGDYEAFLYGRSCLYIQ